MIFARISKIENFEITFINEHAAFCPYPLFSPTNNRPQADRKIVVLRVILHGPVEEILGFLRCYTHVKNFILNIFNRYEFVQKSALPT